MDIIGVNIKMVRLENSYRTQIPNGNIKMVGLEILNTIQVPKENGNSNIWMCVVESVGLGVMKIAWVPNGNNGTKINIKIYGNENLDMV